MTFQRNCFPVSPFSLLPRVFDRKPSHGPTNHNMHKQIQGSTNISTEKRLTPRLSLTTTIASTLPCKTVWILCALVSGAVVQDLSLTHSIKSKYKIIIKRGPVSPMAAKAAREQHKPLLMEVFDFDARFGTVSRTDFPFASNSGGDTKRC